MSDDTYEFQLAVPMTCDDCTKSIGNALSDVGGVESVSFDLGKSLVTVHGSMSPSAVVSAIEDTGRDAIVRGTGAPNSAAVCILEDNDGKPFGLVRIVEFTKNTLFDISVSKALFHSLGSPLLLSIRKFGDISQGALSTGPATDEVATIESTNAIVRKPLSVMSLIGRSMVLSPPSGPTKDSLVGIIARSAGTWELDKTICSCTGRTLWEENEVRKKEISASSSSL